MSFASINWKFWTLRFLVVLLAVVLIYWLVSLTYRLPDLSSRDRSYFISDGADTRLGKMNNDVLSQHPGETGVFMLRKGVDAFAARALLARYADKAIDVQYYMYHMDTIGSLLTNELLKAADRGVRVRLLIDDIYGNVDEDTWVALSAHENIEVRLWNPWVRGRSRLIQSIFRARQVNSRMHAKSFTVDNQVTVLGGRNIGDEYFDADPKVAFSDRDVIAVGPPVESVSNEFDAYWNAEHAFPVDTLIGKGEKSDLEKLKADKADFFQEKSTTDYVQALDNSDLANGLREGNLSWSWAQARVIHDSPMKFDLGKEGREELLIADLAPYITGAKKRIDIMSPYFVPDDKAADALCAKAREGIPVRILTNSLASNDVSAVHAGYAKYRRRLLRCGVELYELDESLKDREGKMFTWLPGLAKSSLHAKSMVFDEEIMFVGSFNFDRRSLFINNEIGLIFHEPGIAGQASKDFHEKLPDVAFRVQFSREGGRENLQWVGGQGGPDTVFEEEPYATTMQKFVVGIVKWLPIDGLL